MGNRLCGSNIKNTSLNSETELEVLDPFIKSIKEHIESCNKQAVQDQLEKLSLENVQDYDAKAKEALWNQSLLHIAVKFDQSVDRHNLKKFLNDQRGISDITDGNPPALHVAIVQGNYKAVEMLLGSAMRKGKTIELLRHNAEGEQFKNTVLMAQLPLSVAALVLKANDSNSKDIVDLLLNNGACISTKNKNGDTLFHSLIRYADIYPDKIFDVTFSFKHLWEKYAESASVDRNGTTKLTDILFWQNKENLTPLQLSVKLGISEIFDYIINISDVYCFQNIKDGLFDIRRYDVTEFDRLIRYIDEQSISGGRSRKLPILEMLFDSRCNRNEAFQILNQKVVQFILQKKWTAYRIFMIIWLILHFSFLSFATTVSILKPNNLVCSGENLNVCDLNEDKIGIGVGYFVFGFIYFFLAAFTISQLVARCYYGGIGLIWHNLDYIICLIVVAVGALIESILTFLQKHWDYHMICLLLCGWYFMLYFSPFHKNLVAFTCMMKAGLMRDFVPFSFIFTFLLVSFTTVMHVLFQGTGEYAEEFHTFGESLLTMFKLGVGLDDIGVLSKSRIPWFAYTMFVLFAILSFIHLLNALIAIMSQTFSDVHNKKSSYHKYQRLCMIELFEDIIVILFLVKLAPFIVRAKHWSRIELTHSEHSEAKCFRYLTTVHSLDDSFYDKDDKEEEMKSNVKMNISQVTDLIRTGNNEVIDMMRNANNEVIDLNL